MRFGGICITTNDVKRLVDFYRIVLEEEPLVEGEHYSFKDIAIYNPGNVNTSFDKNIWLQCFCDDIEGLYNRLLKEIPNIEIISPPERRPWGAYSFWFKDPDGNRIAVAEE